MKLYTKIFIGMILGIIAGWVINEVGIAEEVTRYTDYIGKLFLNMVKMLVVPMVLVSLVVGAASLGDIRKLGKIGGKALLFFTMTTAIASFIGIGSATILQPGKGMSVESREALEAQYGDDAASKTNTESAEKLKDKNAVENILDLFLNMVPTNPFKALASGDMLGIIFFSLFLGLTITMIPAEKADPLIRAFDGLNDAIIKMITLAMELAPYGVFALLLGAVGMLGLDVLLLLLKYGLVVVLGLILHVVITHFSFIYFYVKQSPIKFLRAIKEALVMGFSTSSSSATLPISMNVAQNNLGVSKEMTSFILPLGATINMDGTALYQSVAALFIAQVYDIDLTIAQQLTIILTATLASVGAAGVPGAGMITLAMVLSAIGVPEVGIALIFGLDRLLDMCRTTINIVGDITLSAVMAASEGETIDIRLDKDVIPG